MSELLRLASHHLIRYGMASHQCTGHARVMTRRVCAHCDDVGPCHHLWWERCDCWPDVACVDCLLEAEGKLA